MTRLTWPIVACLGLILATTAAVVVTGHDPTVLVTVLTMLLASSGLLAHQAVRLGQQDQQLTQIENQTNGALDARIEAAISRALTLRDQQHSAALEAAQRLLEGTQAPTPKAPKAPHQ